MKILLNFALVIISLSLLSGCPSLPRPPLYLEPYEYRMKSVVEIVTVECVRKMIGQGEVLGVVKDIDTSSFQRFIVETKLGIVHLSVFKESNDNNETDTSLLLTKNDYIDIHSFSEDGYEKEKDKMEEYLEKLLREILNEC